jgi:four helix bundle protein
MSSKCFDEAEVWKKAHAWVLAVYRLTGQFPRHELFGMTSQLRRAAVSVPANFAEGFKRRGKGDKVRFDNIAQGSLEESRYYLILSRDLGYAETNPLIAMLEEVSRMLEAYIRPLLPPDG